MFERERYSQRQPMHRGKNKNKDKKMRYIEMKENSNKKNYMIIVINFLQNFFSPILHFFLFLHNIYS